MPNEVTYLPDNGIRQGYLGMWGEIFRELRDNRWLAFQLFKRDFFALHQQSLLGVTWAFVMPLMSIASFMLLNQSGILDVGRLDVPYPLYAVLGMAFWQLFAAGLLAGTRSLADAESMITRIKFSKKALVIASIGKALVSFSMQMVLAIILLAAYRIVPSPTVILLPLIALPVLVLTLGLGFLLSIVNGVMRDVSSVLPTCITFLMFLTPVLYARPQIGFIANLASINPLYHFITAARDLTFSGSLSNPHGFFLSCAAAFGILVVCLAAFHLTETRITERL